MTEKHVGRVVREMNVRWWMFRARIENKRGRYAAALKLLKKVITLQPDHALAFLRTGFCLSKLDRRDEALNAYERALQIAPHYAHAHRDEAEKELLVLEKLNHSLANDLRSALASNSSEGVQSN